MEQVSRPFAEGNMIFGSDNSHTLTAYVLREQHMHAQTFYSVEKKGSTLLAHSADESGSKTDVISSNRINSKFNAKKTLGKSK